MTQIVRRRFCFAFWLPSSLSVNVMPWHDFGNLPPNHRFSACFMKLKTITIAVTGLELKACSFENQKTEAKIGVTILNKTTEPGRSVFEQIP